MMHPPVCGYNRMINCDVPFECESCGWNPDVTRRRLEGKDKVPREHEDSDSTNKTE